MMDAYEFFYPSEGVEHIHTEAPFTRSRFSEYDSRLCGYYYGSPYYEFRHKSLPKDYLPPKIGDELWEQAKVSYQGRKTLVHRVEDGVSEVSYYLTRAMENVESNWTYSVYAKR